MANRNPSLGPVLYRMETLDPKVIPVIHRRFPGFVGTDFTAHYQVSFMGRGFGDIVRIGKDWRTLVYYPGGRYRCSAGVHKKQKDAIAAVSDLLTRTEVLAA